MPILSTTAHARPYIESPKTALRLAQIKILLESILQLEIDRALKKRMLVHSLWEVARCTGNFAGRYRSDDVIRTVGVRIQRDHIYRKSALVDELLLPSADIDSVISHAICCVVSIDEHRRLHLVNAGLDGWDRYAAADIVVHDMLTRATLQQPEPHSTGTPKTKAYMVSHEPDFIVYLAGRKSALRYAKFLHDISDTAGRDITPQSLRTTEDIDSFAAALAGNYGDKSVRNYRSVMNAYVRMVRERGL